MNRLLGVPLLLVVATVATPMLGHHEVAPAVHSARAATPVASTEDERVAEGIAVFLAYDQQCEKMPEATVRMAYSTLQTISPTTFRVATAKILGEYQDEGVAQFCTSRKPAADAAMRTLR